MDAQPNFIKTGSNYYKTIAKNQKLTKGSFKKNVRSNLAIFDPPPPLPPCTLSYISRKPPPHSYVLRTFFSPSTPIPSLPFHTHIHIHTDLGNLSTYTFRKFIKSWLFVMTWIMNKWFKILKYIYYKILLYKIHINTPCFFMRS